MVRPLLYLRAAGDRVSDEEEDAELPLDELAAESLLVPESVEGLTFLQQAQDVRLGKSAKK